MKGSSSPSQITAVISNEEIPTCFYKTLTFSVTLDEPSSFMSFISITPPPHSFNFSKSLSDLVAYKSDGDQTLTCYFIFRGENYLWRLLELQIAFHPTSNLLPKWVDIIEKYLSKYFRPKSLLFVINPKAGNNSAKKHFALEIEPILRKLNIKYEVHYTKCRGDATEVGRGISESDLDGIVSLSGDGTFNELVLGILSSENDTQIVPNSIPVAAIPCGTANTFSYSMHGTDDKETALLHILIGDIKKVDIMSVKNINEKLLGVSLTMIAFGFFADAIQDGEGYKKWLPGTLAYSAAFMKYIMKMNKYRCSIALQKTQSYPYEPITCKHDCPTCNSDPPENEVERVESHEPKIFGIQLHNHTSKCEMSPRGASAFGCFGNGSMDCHIMRDVTRSEVGEMLKEVGKKAHENPKDEFDFIENMRVNKILISNFGSESETGKSGYILDGEFIEQEPIEIQCHQKVLTYFGRGLELDFGTESEPLLDKQIQQSRNVCSSCSIQ